MKTKTCFPCLEQPTRCFFSHNNKQIKCTPEGTILSTTNRKGWEEWYIQEEPGGIVKIQSCAHNKYLVCNADGCVSACCNPSHNEHLWRISKIQQNNMCTLVSVTNGQYLTCTGNIISMIDKHHEGSNQEWKIEYRTGELCFLSSLKKDGRLTCNPFGKINMSTNWEGWEVWRFIEVGDGRVLISSWTHSSKILCSSGDGKTYTTENSLGEWEKWIIEKAPGQFDGVVIKSASHNRYLRYTGKTIDTCAHFQGDSSVWHLHAGHRQCFYVSSISRDKRISFTKDGVCGTNNRKAWEEWELIKLEDDYIALHSKVHGKYLSCDSRGDLQVTDEINEKGMWLLETPPHSFNGICLVSKVNDYYLSIDETGMICTVNGQMDVSETWKFEVCMPSTITGEKMGHLAIGGAIAVASIALMPFAAMGIVGAIGFGAEGIAAGSIAAAMMSAEAIASGGAIAATGTVATLQSVGAVGLGLAGTSAAMGTGALVGASAVGIAAAAPTKTDKSSSSTEVTHACGNRQFCNWRSW